MMGRITITNQTISFGNKIIRTSNVSSIELRSLAKGNNKLLIFTGVFSLIGVAVAWHQFPKMKMLEGIFSVAFWFSISMICFWLNFRGKQKSHRYLIVIHTNAGNFDFLSSSDLAFIKLIQTKIAEAMESGTHQVNYTINLDSRTVINNPMGSIQITHVKNYSGMSDADKKFLSNEFESALDKVRSKVNASNDERLQKNFELLKNELKSSKPRKSILESTWSVIGNIGGLADLASTMEKAFNLFS